MQTEHAYQEHYYSVRNRKATQHQNRSLARKVMTPPADERYVASEWNQYSPPHEEVAVHAKSEQEVSNPSATV